MLRNYFVVAWRNLLRHKLYSLINISGLAVGMASCILILLYVRHELSYERFHENAEQIYRASLERPSGSRNVSTPLPLAPTLVEEFPEVVRAVRLFNPDNPVPLVRHGNRRFYEKNFFFADADIFELFSFSLIQGDPQRALADPFSVVLTEETARKYFGDQEPLGKTIHFKNWLDLKVTGVLRDLPANTDFRFDFLTSFATVEKWLGSERMRNWHNTMCYTYVQLQEGSGTGALEEKLPAFVEEHFNKNEKIARNLHLQQLTRVHLYSSQSGIQRVYVFSTIAFFLLLVACINYVNLATARSGTRAREVGMRKVVGARRAQLVQQFIGESVCLTLIAFILALVLVEMTLPAFRSFVGKNVVFAYGNAQVLIGLAGILLGTGVLSGGYPTFFLSGLRPVEVLKGRSKTGRTGFWLRKVLVVGQFSLSIALIIGTAVTFSQLDYVKTQDLGFDEEQVIVAPLRVQELRQAPEALKEELLESPYVVNVAGAALLPGGPVGRTSFQATSAPLVSEPTTLSMLWVDADFIGTLGIRMKAGRDFSAGLASDADQAFIINQAAVKRLGWESPEEAIGQPFERIHGPDSGERASGAIIGVVEDFHFQSLRSEIEPLVIHLWPWLNYLVVRVRAEQMPETLAYMERIWESFDPDHPFEYSFLDETFAALYRMDERQGQVFGIFAALAVLIACLGLFGLAAFTAEQRTKEIGIRKVLGASVAYIVVLLSKEFTWLVIIANGIAWPLAYYAMRRWLENFAYRIELELEVFVLGGLLALGIACLTVSIQAIKAALSNPVNALRYE